MRGIGDVRSNEINARNAIAKYALSLESFYLNKIIIIMAIIKNYTTVKYMTGCGGSKGEIKR